VADAEPGEDRVPAVGAAVPPNLRGRAPRMRSTGPTLMDGLSDAARGALVQHLEPGERVERILTAVGCTLIMTQRRLVLVRDGATFRRRTGVQSWPLDDRLDLQLTPVRRGTGRLLIQRAGKSTSVFLPETHMDDARMLIARGRRGAA
jgi:hypothetical protein